MQIHFLSPITKVNGGEQRPNNVPPRLQRRCCREQPVREARHNRNNVLQTPHGLATETRAPRRRVSDYAEESWLRCSLLRNRAATPGFEHVAVESLGKSQHDERAPLLALKNGHDQCPRA